ncbi:ABC transporter substrate-binding protein [Fretibacter rubidus]|uniref:ABC transporter substrate-binding protein n=1 Tax=Fretibacter rubidus TaxID=570162 RepID=UPI00352B63A9
MRWFIISLVGILGACSAAPIDIIRPMNTAPTRVVSLDYCADQYVLKMVPRDNILALSPDAAKAFSYLRDEAVNIPSVRPIAEDVLILKPDLVVRSYGGGPDAQRFFESANIPVVNVGWANDLDGIGRVTLEMADALGASELGEAMVADFDARRAALPAASGQSALYVTPSGVTSGSGSLVHEMISAAGLSNFQTQSGWRSLPLERMASETPDVIAAAFFDTKSQNKDAWSAMRHPIARDQMTSSDVVPLQGAWTSCGAWYLMDAVEALAGTRHD